MVRRARHLLVDGWLNWVWGLALAVAATAPVDAGSVAPRVDYTAPLTEGGGYTVSGIAADAEGNVWVAGTTTSHNFPITEDAADSTFLPEDFDEGYAIKFSPAGEILYATYLGGRNVDDTGSITIDEDGSVFVAGTTLSDDFPVTAGAYQPQLISPGQEDIFLVKLDANGELLYSTYFGGNGRDLFPGGSRGNPGVAVTLGPDGSVYLASGTISTDLPTSGAYQPEYAGGGQDIFLAKFTPTLLFDRCTYFGGTNNEGAYRAGVDAAGNVYLFGFATRIFGAQWTLPVTTGALLTNPTGDALMFVTKFDVSMNLVYATFLGPIEGDSYFGQYQGDLAVDPQGNAYVVSVTTSPNFPTTQGAFQTSISGFSDLTVSKLNPEGTALVYSTYFGGTAAEYANGEPGVRIAVNDAGNAYIVGVTDSRDLPLKNAFTSMPSGRFLTKLDVSGGDLEYSSYLDYRGLGVEAVALFPQDGSAAGNGSNIAVYVGGPTAEPRGLAVLGISEGGSAPGCSGDCNGDGNVGIDELVQAARYLLQQTNPAECSGLDSDGNQLVDISELLGAVGSLLETCD